jgi:hypothetical protein
MEGEAESEIRRGVPAGGRPPAARRAGLEGVEKLLTPLDAWSAERKRMSARCHRHLHPAAHPLVLDGETELATHRCSLLALPAFGGSKRTTSGIL